MSKDNMTLWSFQICLLGWLIFVPLRDISNELNDLNSRINKITTFLNLDLNTDKQEYMSK